MKSQLQAEDSRKPVWLCDECVADFEVKWLLGYIAQDGICYRCGVISRWAYDASVKLPRWDGDIRYRDFSTSVTLDLYQRVVWDVNGYYRYLGVSPKATRRELRRAYQEVGGHDDERATYIIKVLLDPERRAVYDACRPGEIFFDEYVKRSVMDEIHRRAREFHDDEEVDEIVEQIDLDPMVDHPYEMVDGASKDSYNASTAAWGYVSWDCRPNDLLAAAWRQSLVEHLAGEAHRIRIGIASKRQFSERWSIQWVDGHPVVFIRDDESPRECGEAASEGVRSLQLLS